MITLRNVCYYPAKSMSGDQLYYFTIMDSFARGDVIIGSKINDDVTFDDVSIVPFLLSLFYGLASSSAFNDELFSVSGQEQDEVADFGVADEKIISILLRRINGEGYGDRACIYPLACGDVLSAMKAAIEGCSSIIRNEYFGKITDPLVRLIFARLTRDEGLTAQ